VAAAGGAGTVVAFDGALHGCQLLYPFVPEARASLRSAADFIAAHLSS
jgi:acetyl esterase/lipase